MARPGLERNRKFIYLVSVVKSRAIARGVLDCMWDVAYESGDPVLGSPSLVEYICGWTELGRQQGVLFQALRDAGKPNRKGFIEEATGRPGEWQIHDLRENEPDYVKRRRSRDAERRRAAEAQDAALRVVKGGGHNKIRFPGGSEAPAIAALEREPEID